MLKQTAVGSTIDSCPFFHVTLQNDSIFFPQNAVFIIFPADGVTLKSFGFGKLEYRHSLLSHSQAKSD